MKSHESLVTATVPAWSEATTDASTGVDYLGTRAVNLAMLTRLTGAYNNVVVSARQHAILCWAAWRYRENCREAQTAPRRDEFRGFLDAVETIQLIGQREHGQEFGGTTRGLGSNALRNLEGLEPIPLRFDRYDRSHDNTSALAAVQYGPSAKPGSFGFLDTVSQIWGPTQRGERLALALDPIFRASATYQRLATLPPPEELGLDAITDFARLGLVIGPALADRPEREPYIAALFDLDGQPVSPDHERRLTLALLLEAATQLGGLATVTDLRAVFLSGRRPDGTPLEWPTYLRRTAARWQILELRQLQRYALESWLYWVESCMKHRAGAAADFVDAFGDALAGVPQPDDDLAAALSRPAGEAVTNFLHRRSITDPLAWGATSHPGTPWGLQAAIKAELAVGLPIRAAPAILGLTLAVLALSPILVCEPAEYRFYAIGDRRRISLPHFSNWWTRRADVPLRAALVDFLEELVLQQHVAVAVSRFDNDQRRLRFSNDDGGWALLPGTAPIAPSLTPDRIGALLSLMADLALFDVGASGFTITDAGRDVLHRVAEQVAREERPA